MRDQSASVLCIFWEEDGEWIGIVEEFPIVVSGRTFEEARHNMGDGIESHFRVLAKKGKLAEASETLAKPKATVEELPMNRLFLKLPVPTLAIAS